MCTKTRRLFKKYHESRVDLYDLLDEIFRRIFPCNAVKKLERLGNERSGSCGRRKVFHLPWRRKNSTEILRSTHIFSIMRSSLIQRFGSARIIAIAVEILVASVAFFSSISFYFPTALSQKIFSFFYLRINLTTYYFIHYYLHITFFTLMNNSVEKSGTFKPFNAHGGAFIYEELEFKINQIMSILLFEFQCYRF